MIRKVLLGLMLAVSLKASAGQPVPQIIRIQPACFTIGTPFRLVILGNNFVGGVQVYFDGALMPGATVVSKYEIDMMVEVSVPRTINVTIRNKSVSNTKTVTAQGVIDLGTVGKQGTQITPVQLPINCPSWE